MSIHSIYTDGQPIHDHWPHIESLIRRIITGFLACTPLLTNEVLRPVLIALFTHIHAVCGGVVVNGCGSFHEESLPDIPPHPVIKEHTDNTKPFILHFFWKHTSIELKRSVSYMFKKNLFPMLLAVITEKSHALIKSLTARNKGRQV